MSKVDDINPDGLFICEVSCRREYCKDASPTLLNRAGHAVSGTEPYAPSPKYSDPEISEGLIAESANVINTVFQPK
jgi:hypothetical protein